MFLQVLEIRRNQSYLGFVLNVITVDNGRPEYCDVLVVFIRG